MARNIEHEPAQRYTTMAAIGKKSRELLETLAAAGAGGAYVDPKAVAPLVKNGLVEVNEDATDADGNIAARVTQSGTEAVQPMEQPQAASTEATGGHISGIVSGVAPPKRAARSRSGRYPFDQLEPEQSFFVAATDDMPKPAASLGGTVSGANRRYAEETGATVTNRRGREVPELKLTRKFFVRAVDDGAPWGFPGVAGAAVFREF